MALTKKHCRFWAPKIAQKRFRCKKPYKPFTDRRHTRHSTSIAHAKPPHSRAAAGSAILRKASASCRDEYAKSAQRRGRPPVTAHAPCAVPTPMKNATSPARILGCTSPRSAAARG